MTKCEIHQPSFRHHLFNAFDAHGLRLHLYRNTLYLFYRYKLDLAKIQEAVAGAFLDSFVNPIDEQRQNLLSKPSGELVSRVHSELLRQVAYIEYVGPTEHDEVEIDGRGWVTYQYKISIKRITDIWISERAILDEECARVCLQGEQFVTEAHLIHKYQALFVLPLSHYRARKALQRLETGKIIKNNGNRRKLGYDVLKIA